MVTSLVRSIPDGIWGVIVGSVLAFGGTFIATWRQLRHDAEQRERDRKMQLRRDVFFAAADGVAVGSDYFMKLANAEAPLTDLTTSSSPPSGWLNKLYTVASLETIEAFSIASASLAAFAFDLVRRRLSVEDVKGKLDAANQQIEAMKAVLQRIRESVAATASEAKTPEVLGRLEQMQHHWDQTCEELERLRRLTSTLLGDKVRLQRDLLEQAVSYSIEYQKKLRKALVALRGELEFPLDHARFEALMEGIDAEMLPKFKAVLDAIDSDAQLAAAGATSLS
jgi:predicted  nucleic acid-binding Zn-ribbon protein